jgi:Mrp family chromosome partitioning ATPase/capsular polysaccharide biosynthesis protein
MHDHRSVTRDRITAFGMDPEIRGWSETAVGPAASAQQREEGALLPLFRFLRSNARLIGGTALAVGLLAFALSLVMSKRYATTASLLFQQSPLVGQVTGFNPGNDFNTVAEEGATNVALVGSRPVAAGTAARLGKGFDVKSVRDAIDLNARPNTRVVDITATGATPVEAQRIANTYASVFLDGRRREVQSEIRRALDDLEGDLRALPAASQAGATGKELTQRINTLRVLRAVQSPNVELIQPAPRPDHAASPRPFRNAVLGILFGLLLGIGFSAVRQQVDQRVRDVDELETLTRRPLLGVVPRDRSLARGAPAVELTPGVADAFHSVELGLRYRGAMPDSPCILVTSAAVGEGKTVCAWHLAAMMAATGKRTLYIEADLRHANAAKRWDLDPGPGLADVLRGRARRRDALQQVRVTRVRGDDEPVAHLDVLPAGEAGGSATELFDSPVLRELLEECAADYDAVVVDAPSLSGVAEAVPLAIAASGAVIVASPGTTPRRGLERLRDGLDQLGVPVYGVIANNVRQASLAAPLNPFS